MHLLSELLSLLEAPARLHVNGKLSVLADLIEEEFGEALNALPMYHKCLIAQIAYIIKARTPLTIDKIIHMALTKYVKMSDAEIKEIGKRGTTPEQTIAIWNGRRVTVGGKTYKLECKFHAYHGVKQLVSAVKAGHPVLVPFNVDSDFATGSENHDGEGRYVRSEEEFYFPPEHGSNARHHVLLAVGVDDESEEVIMRDIRSTYLHKGYVKIPFDVADEHTPTSFTFDVDMKEV
jgi:hypothetical protein